VFDSEGIQAKWEESSFGKRRLARLRRATLSDFERFQVMMHKKEAGLKLRQEMKKAAAK
jgi:large subunit ribosomal protein L14e